MLLRRQLLLMMTVLMVMIVPVQRLRLIGLGRAD